VGNGEGREERWMDLAVGRPAVGGSYTDSAPVISVHLGLGRWPLEHQCPRYLPIPFNSDRPLLTVRRAPCDAFAAAIVAVSLGTGSRVTKIQKNYCSLIIIAVLGCVRRTSGNSADSGVTKEIREGKMHHDDFELLHG